MAEFNDDELRAPEWLNEDFFRKVLQHQNSRQEAFTVYELTIAPATLKGDHFASIMFRVGLTYGGPGDTDPRKCSMIVKTLPLEGTAKADILSDKHIFENELKLYTTLIPMFEEEWRRCGEPVKFSGSLLYHSTRTPRPVLVLEDLCASGYEVLRERPFNCDEVKLCLHKLSQWHAVSYKLATTQQDNGGGDVTAMQHGIFKQHSVVTTDFISGGMHCLREALTEAGGLEEYQPQLGNLAPQLIERCVRLNDAFACGVVGPIYVLNHGDLHDKNIMVKRAAGKESPVVDMLFIDFQQSFFGPAAYDMIFANFALFSSELRSLKHEELFAFYVAHFRTNLAKLKVPAPWPDTVDFEEDYKRWNCLELFMVATFMPLMHSDDGEVDFNLIFHSKAYRRKFYKHPDYLAYLKTLLPIYMEAGYLN